MHFLKAFNEIISMMKKWLNPSLKVLKYFLTSKNCAHNAQFCFMALAQRLLLTQMDTKLEEKVKQSRTCIKTNDILMSGIITKCS